MQLPQQGAAPQGGTPVGPPQISPEIMQMIMQALSAMPDVPAGGMAHTKPAGAVPQMAKLLSHLRGFSEQSKEWPYARGHLYQEKKLIQEKSI